MQRRNENRQEDFSLQQPPRTRESRPDGRACEKLQRVFLQRGNRRENFVNPRHRRNARAQFRHGDRTSGKLLAAHDYSRPRIQARKASLRRRLERGRHRQHVNRSGLSFADARSNGVYDRLDCGAAHAYEGERCPRPIARRLACVPRREAAADKRQKLQRASCGNAGGGRARNVPPRGNRLCECGGKIGHGAGECFGQKARACMDGCVFADRKSRSRRGGCG